MEFHVFKARLNAGNRPEWITTFNAKNIDEAEKAVKEKLRLNPFYTVIVDSELNEVYNEHLQLGKEYIKNFIENDIPVLLESEMNEMYQKRMRQTDEG